MNNDTTLPPGVRRETKEITGDEIDQAIAGVAMRVIELMNEHSKQHGATTALFGCLYAAGAALANYGAVLDEGVDLRAQLLPLFEGFNDQKSERSH